MSMNNFLEKISIVLNRFVKHFETDSLEFNHQTVAKKQYLPPMHNAGNPRDTVIVVDVSMSMEDCDYYPTRLDGGIEAGIEYINARAKYPGDKIAVVSFSDDACIVLGLTDINKKSKIISALCCLTIEGGTNITKGLKAAITVFDNNENNNHLRHVILLTDGYGSNPVRTAEKLKEQYAVIDVVGIGGTPDAVNTKLLRKVATTDPDGFNRYYFIKDSKTLREHYRKLATGLVWSKGKND